MQLHCPHTINWEKTPLYMEEGETQSFPAITGVVTPAQLMHQLATAGVRIKPVVHRLGTNIAHWYWSTWCSWKVWHWTDKFAVEARERIWWKV